MDELKIVTQRTSVLGNPFDEATYQGPQVSKTQYDRVLDFIESGKTQGAKVALGGTPNTDVGNGKGYFINPTIFTEVSSGMTIYKEEVFGPVVAIVSFQTEEEALSKANDTSYGLGAAVFTENIKRSHRVAAHLEAGTVWVNSSNDGDFRVPFGGVKQSGIGRELGEAGLQAYSQLKAVHVNLGNKLQ